MKEIIIAFFCGRVFFFVVFASLLAWWEGRAPWRIGLSSRRERWARHLSLQALGKAAVRVIFPFTILGLAFLVEEKQLGFFNHKPIPYVTEVILGILALDLTVYLQHRLLHRNTLLWYVHRVHHLDKELDASTGLRFHPFEELFSMASKTMIIAFLGITPLAVIIFEVWLNFAALYTHLNVRLKNSTEKALRWLIVTPGMHRIHHSDFPAETNSNYGFGLSWWDRLFRTYRPASLTGESNIVLGLSEFREEKYQTLVNLLLMPFNLKKLKSRPKPPIKTKFSS